MSNVNAYIESQQEQYLQTLFRLLRQPSISAQNIGTAECAEILMDIMTQAGIEPRLLPTDGGPPVVYGELTTASDAPTLLIYGHYDVQPPEPLEAWHSPPFEPTIRDGRIYCRGVGDNKGQLLAHVLAIKALNQVRQMPRINLKFLYEGEEESGSPHLPAFVEKHRDMLKADAMYWADGGMHEAGPRVSFGSRGILYVELNAKGAARDAHSGNRGGVLPNPAWELVHLLDTMRTPDGYCTIEGFYDGVRPPTDYERQLMAAIPHDEASFLAEWELTELPPPVDWSFHERIMFQPTFNICGFVSGYGGQGTKTVIPSRAKVKMDMRLVADQHPDDIWEKFVRYVKAHAPNIQVTRIASLVPSKTSVELPVSQTIIRSVAEIHGREPIVFPTSGGSGPSYLFTGVLGIPTACVPYANHDEDNHAPNENMEVECFVRGIKISARVFRETAALSKEELAAR